MGALNAEMSSVGHEIRVLLAVARLQTQADGPERLRAALQAELDWTRLLRLAARHRLRPLLYRHVERTAMDLVPAPVLGKLHEHVVEAARRSLVNAGELLKIVRLLKTHGITAVPYKGPALAAQLYGDCALREYNDLDLLVAQDHVWRAGDLLETLDYAPAFVGAEGQRAAYAAAECDLLFVHRQSGLPVELHWAITPRYFSFPVSASHLLEGIEWGDLLGEPVARIAPEELLLIICVNATKEMWGRLDRLCEIAQLIRLHPNLHWGRLLDRARLLGARRILTTGLCLAHELLSAPLPPDVLRQVVADGAAARLAGSIPPRWITDGETRPSVWSLTRFRLRSRERWRDRVRYCALRLTIPTRRDLGYVALPPSLFWIHYLVRPIRLIQAATRPT